MPGSLCTVLAGCLVASVFGATAARAATGRIMFSGAVVEPTCSAVDAGAAVMASPRSGGAVVSRRFTCGSAGTATDTARSYSLQVVSLDTAASGDHLLDYFAGYINAVDQGRAKARLVIQTFE